MNDTSTKIKNHNILGVLRSPSGIHTSHGYHMYKNWTEDTQIDLSSRYIWVQGTTGFPIILKVD